MTDDGVDPVTSHADMVIERADEFDARVDAKTERVINDLVEFRSRAVRQQRVVGAVVAVLVVVVIVLSFALIKIADNSATIRQACDNINKANAKQVLLWNHILDFPPPSNETDDQKKQRIEFKQFMLDTFAPIDCKQPQVP